MASDAGVEEDVLLTGDMMGLLIGEVDEAEDHNLCFDQSGRSDDNSSSGSCGGSSVAVELAKRLKFGWRGELPPPPLAVQDAAAAADEGEFRND